MHNDPNFERVVVTGIGAVSSIGMGKQEFWDNLLEGRSGVSAINTFDTGAFRTVLGGQVRNFNEEIFFPSLSAAKRYGRASQFGIAATKLALNDAGLQVSDLGLDGLSVIIGTTNGECQEMEHINDKWVRFGEEGIDNKEILKYPGSLIALNIVKEVGITADCIVIPTACAAGNYAIGYGYDRILTKEASVVIAGGCDCFSRAAFTGFNGLFAVAPEKCQPFDKNRKGIIVGEGAGVVILESLAHAVQRGATIYAEVMGYALSCDASHMTIPSVEGIVSVMQKALTASRVRAEDVSYISAHGTGTVANDKTESAAVNRVFGNSKIPPISSIKSMLGHTMGAASALEAIACAMAIHSSKIPPTINFQDSDNECRVDCVPNKMRQLEVKIALNNSFAFGGNNACLVLKRYEGTT